MTIIYNHHNANLWHKVLVSTLNGSSFRKSQSKQNKNLPPQKKWGQRQSGRLRDFLLGLHQNLCANMSWWVHFGCVTFVDVCYFIFWLLHAQHFWELVSEMVFKQFLLRSEVIELRFWKNRWKWCHLDPLSDQSTVWRLQDVTASSTLWETKGMSNKSDTTNVVFFYSFVHIFWCTSWGRSIISFPWRSFVWDIFATRAWTPEKSISQEAHMEVGSAQARTTI